jgi:hypothetical protein
VLLLDILIFQTGIYELPLLPIYTLQWKAIIMKIHNTLENLLHIMYRFPSYSRILFYMFKFFKVKVIYKVCSFMSFWLLGDDIVEF